MRDVRDGVVELTPHDEIGRYLERCVVRAGNGGYRVTEKTRHTLVLGRQARDIQAIGRQTVTNGHGRVALHTERAERSVRLSLAAGIHREKYRIARSRGVHAQ